VLSKDTVTKDRSGLMFSPQTKSSIRHAAGSRMLASVGESR
jgi:hypothetical protein